MSLLAPASSKEMLERNRERLLEAMNTIHERNRKRMIQATTPNPTPMPAQVFRVTRTEQTKSTWFIEASTKEAAIAYLQAVHLTAAIETRDIATEAIPTTAEAQENECDRLAASFLPPSEPDASPPISSEELAKAAYARYGAVTDFKNFRGDPMPAWEALGENIQSAWIAAITTHPQGTSPNTPYPSGEPDPGPL